MASEDQEIAKDLCQAAAKGNIERLRELLDDGAGINSGYDGGPHAFWRGDTPLHAAVRMGRVETVRFLLRRGADPNSRDLNGWTPLFNTIAAQGGAETAAILIKAGADVNARSSRDHAPIHIAARIGIRDLVDLFMARGAKPDLVVAAYLDDLAMARRVLASGADVNYRLADGKTALHCASWKGHVEFVAFLIEHGADVDAKDQHGRTPMHMTHNAAIARLLHEAGADISARDNRDRTPLHHAVDDLAEYLLSVGAEVDPVDKLGRTPLSEAARGDRGGLGELLIEHGAKVDLHIAAGLGMLDKVREFLDAGADANAVGHGGYTPLHLAAVHGLKEMIRLLVDRGADTNARSSQGRTPLHLLTNLGALGPSSEDSVEMARMLLDHGADADARDNEGELPILWAIDQGPDGLVKLIEQHMSEDAKSSIAHLLNR